MRLQKLRDYLAKASMPTKRRNIRREAPLVSALLASLTRTPLAGTTAGLDGAAHATASMPIVSARGALGQSVPQPRPSLFSPAESMTCAKESGAVQCPPRLIPSIGWTMSLCVYSHDTLWGRLIGQHRESRISISRSVYAPIEWRIQQGFRSSTRAGG